MVDSTTPVLDDCLHRLFREAPSDGPAVDDRLTQFFRWLEDQFDAPIPLTAVAPPAVAFYAHMKDLSSDEQADLLALLDEFHRRAIGHGVTTGESFVGAQV